MKESSSKSKKGEKDKSGKIYNRKDKSTYKEHKEHDRVVLKERHHGNSEYKHEDKSSKRKHDTHIRNPHKNDRHEKRSESPLHNKRHKNLSSEIGVESKSHHRSSKKHNDEINESYEELSRRKRRIESELQALDLEEAAQKEAENKKHRSSHESKRKVDDIRIKEESTDDDNERYGQVSNHHKKKHSLKTSSDETWGRSNSEAKKESQEKEKPNFSVSGKLAEDTNTYNGVVIKYNEPSEARKPRRRWRLYPFKGDTELPFIPIHRQSAYLFGRSRLIADIPIDHPSCSKQHAVLQYRLVSYKREDGTTGKRVRPYIIDLDSSNGTFINNKTIEPRCYVELFEKDVIKFGFSTREYVILHEESKDNFEDDDVIEK